MSKTVSFRIKLNVDGKDQLVTATSSVKDLHRAVKDARPAFETLTGSFNSIGFAVQNLQGILGGITGSLNSLTAESRQFGGAMAAANTMAGKSGEDFQKMKDQVAELAKTIPLAREELANGLYQVISNGVPEKNWISYLEQSAKASVGGIADLGETVKVTSTVIKNYGLSWESAGNIQDKIQLTAKNGVTSFEQLAQALPRVTSNAATLGVSIDELMATFSTLTGVSGNTAEVSTQLGAIFTALVKPSSEATKMAQQMGIEFNAASIKAAGGMQNFLAELDKSVKSYASSSGMLEQEVYGKLFGSAESLRAIGPLTGQLSDTFKKNVAAMKDSAGTIDEAFQTMGSTGSASVQKMENQISSLTDAISAKLTPVLPLLNITQEVGMSLVSLFALANGFKKLGISVAGSTIAMKGASAAGAVWRSTATSVNAIMQVCSATMRGTAVSTQTLNAAIRGLAVATGIGAAIAALSVIVEKLGASHAQAANSAADMAKVENQASDSVKEAYEGTLKQTYGDLMGKYEQLKAGWKSLSSTHQKMDWIKQNQGAFSNLGMSINSVSSAESVFNGNTDAVVEAFQRRAEAAAYASKLTALYEKQIGLQDKKQKITEDIANDAKRSGRHAQAGDLIPEGWRNERYGGVGNDGQWRFSEKGARLYSGTGTQGNAQVQSINKQLGVVQKEITNTAQRMKSANALVGKTIITGKPTLSSTPSTPHVKTGKVGGSHTTKEEKPAAVGSMDWYDQEMQRIKKLRDATGNEDEAKKWQSEYERLDSEYGELKIRLGIETPKESEVEDVKSQLENKLDVYSTAQQKGGQVQQAFDAGIINKDEADRQIKEINDELNNILGDGVKPIELDVEIPDTKELQQLIGSLNNIDLTGFSNVQSALEAIVSIPRPLEKGMSAAGAACGALGTSLQKLGADSEAAKAGMVLSAIGQLVLSFSQAMVSASSNWITWLAFGVSGIAQLTSLISTVSQFATGGIVPGTQKSGDKVLARVNSGEMILNTRQQSRLFSLLDGREKWNIQGPTVPVSRYSDMNINLGDVSGISGTASGGEVRFEIDGRKLIGVLRNETRISSKSGRHTGIVI